MEPPPTDTPTPAPSFATPAEAAARLGCSTRTLARHIRAGKLPAGRIGARVRIRVADLDEFVRGQAAR